LARSRQIVDAVYGRKGYSFGAMIYALFGIVTLATLHFAKPLTEWLRERYLYAVEVPLRHAFAMGVSLFGSGLLLFVLTWNAAANAAAIMAVPIAFYTVVSVSAMWEGCWYVAYVLFVWIRNRHDDGY
jgi:hypothetical protein